MQSLPTDLVQTNILLRLSPKQLFVWMQVSRHCNFVCQSNHYYWEYIAVHLLWQRCFSFVDEMSFRFRALTTFENLWRFEGLENLTRREMIVKYCTEEEQRLLRKTAKEIVAGEVIQCQIKRKALEEVCAALKLLRNDHASNVQEKWTELVPSELIQTPESWDCAAVQAHTEYQLSVVKHWHYRINVYFKFIE